jgi:hypothetical protein
LIWLPAISICFLWWSKTRKSSDGWQRPPFWMSAIDFRWSRSSRIESGFSRLDVMDSRNKPTRWKPHQIINNFHRYCFTRIWSAVAEACIYESYDTSPDKCRRYQCAPPQTPSAKSLHKMICQVSCQYGVEYILGIELSTHRALLRFILTYRAPSSSRIRPSHVR